MIKVSQLVQSLYLGILVIDDIQNLCSAKNDVSDELLSFMVSMANNLRIPVIQVGSPKVLTLLQKEFQVAKRASGEGEIRMDLMKKDSPEWERFITTLWKYQYTAKEIALTDTLKEVFFNLSVGNPFIAATLYKIVQDEAIISGRERFTEKDVKRIEKSQMGMTVKMRRDMLNGVDVELNRYHALWEAAQIPPTLAESPQNSAPRDKSETNISILETEIANQLLGETGLTLQEARIYARKAIAANPGETNISVLIGYVRTLQQKTNEGAANVDS